VAEEDDLQARIGILNLGQVRISVNFLFVVLYGKWH
jgi:hypothetical protein